MAKRPVQSPRRDLPISDVHDHRPAREFFDLIQNLVDSINGVKDENGFLTMVLMNVRITVGINSPETVVTGDVGDLFIRTNGGAATVLYVKESGAAKVGWIGK